MRREEEVVFVEEPEGRPLAITFNPLPLLYGRLSGNVEILLATHHALVVSPNVLAWNTDRGDAHNLVSRGFGFASPTSSSLGIEVGYHYWARWTRSMRGLYFGPSVLLGATGNPDIGDPNATQGYWGLAFDVGRQEVLPGGFTLGGGFGIGMLRMGDWVAVFPRLLVQLGWSF